MLKIQECRQRAMRRIYLMNFPYPEEQSSGMKLSDILEKEVDEKYFLSEKAIDYLARASERDRLRIEIPQLSPKTTPKEFIQEAKRTSLIKQLNSPKHSNDRIYGHGVESPALNTMQGGDRQPKVLVCDDPSRKKAMVDKDNAPTLRSEAHGNNPCVMICQS